MSSHPRPDGLGAATPVDRPGGSSQRAKPWRAEGSPPRGRDAPARDLLPGGLFVPLLRWILASAQPQLHRRLPAHPVPDPRPRQQIHHCLRRGLPQRRDQSDPHTDPRSTGKRLRRAVRPHDPSRVSRLAPDPGPTPPRTRAPPLQAHYNRERPHRGLALLTPEPASTADPSTLETIERRDQLGGLIHEYHRAAA